VNQIRSRVDNCVGFPNDPPQSARRKPFKFSVLSMHYVVKAMGKPTIVDTGWDLIEKRTENL
jgi:hypothetical protein